MSAKTARDSKSLIIYALSMCGNIRTDSVCEAGSEGLQSTTLSARFWAKVDRKSDSDCWLWTGAERRDGYGSLKINGRTYAAHRVSYLLAHGRLPSGAVVLHACDRPLCVNPAHLTAGTQRQNVLDSIRKGRHVNPDWRRRKHVRNQYSRKVAA